MKFDEGDLYSIYFQECEFDSINMLLETTINVNFVKCYIDVSFFFSIQSVAKDKFYTKNEIYDLYFEECRIGDTCFSSADLRNSLFRNTAIHKCSFIDCKLDTHTIIQTQKTEYINYSAIDFQSILKSNDIDSKILKEFFNINSPDIRKIVQNITSEISFKSLFISYSFKDKQFANSLNNELTNIGIKTFLWEKDAPGGHRLEEIMMINVNKHDKILFISSEHSIRSKACQFELTEARKKQEASWATDIFYLVHLDNYLFGIKKNMIRPISKVEEYWENIEELRRVNSVDFSRFISGYYDPSEFTKAVESIVVELKIAEV
ncbi:MAG: toll/interleukin-1 receptor domain-containing protein [Bacteroidota bacterium]|nr:toll/interleukin-1 receptor domain-containing protein [Bacteroidota bacterium]